MFDKLCNNVIFRITNYIFKSKKLQHRWFRYVSKMLKNGFFWKQTLYAEVNVKKSVQWPWSRWLDYKGSWVETLGTSSKRNAVCVGRSRIVAV